ncbi:MAG: hypothetical protein V4591_07675 [Bdellovibrionota bacterium]
MKIFFFLFSIICLSSCGYKAPPSPIFSSPKTQSDDEIKFRNVEQKKEKKPKLLPENENVSK